MEKNKYTFFKSDITTEFFGNGIALEMLTRDELKKYLKEISGIFEKESNVDFVINYYKDPVNNLLGEEWFMHKLHEIRDDIKIIQSKLTEQ